MSMSYRLPASIRTKRAPRCAILRKTPRTEPRGERMVRWLRLCAQLFVPALINNTLPEVIEQLTPVACFPFDCCANPLRERPSFCDSHGSEHHVRGEVVFGHV